MSKRSDPAAVGVIAVLLIGGGWLLGSFIEGALRIVALWQAVTS